LGNERAVELLDSDPVGRKHRALIRRAIRRDGRALLVQPYGHAARICVLQHALQGEETAAADNRGLNLVVATPALQTAVRVENFRQQLVHGFPFQSSSAIAGTSKRSPVSVSQPPSMRPIKSSGSRRAPARSCRQPIDPCDIRIRSPQCSGRSNTGKTNANDNDPLLLWLG